MSSNGLETTSKTAKVHQVRAEIESLVRNGYFSSGALLPAERELAKRFSVSRLTVRKAVSMLTDDGIVEKLPGRGSLVTDTSQIVVPNAIDGGIILDVIIVPSRQIGEVGISYTDCHEVTEDCLSWSRQMLTSLSRRGYSMMCTVAYTADLGLGIFPQGLDYDKVSAFILDGFVDDYHISLFQQFDRPVLVYGNQRINIPVSKVGYNTSKASYLITKALLSLEVGPVMLINGPFEFHDNRDCMAGYVAACIEADADTYICTTTNQARDRYIRELRTILEKTSGPYALFANCDDAQTIFDIYNELGISFTEHPVAVFSLDPITAGRHITEEIAFCFPVYKRGVDVLAKLLDEALAGEKPRSVILEPEMTYNIENGRLRVESCWVDPDGRS